jgi:4-amino-4-deoxy-L-arabinose transferase-like glycosyltransferase
LTRNGGRSRSAASRDDPSRTRAAATRATSACAGPPPSCRRNSTTRRTARQPITSSSAATPPRTRFAARRAFSKTRLYTTRRAFVPGGSPRKLRALVGLLIAASLALAFLGLYGQDPTDDERFYFGVGRTLLLTGRWQGFAAHLHPPLSYYVNSLPLLAVRDAAPSYWDPLLLRLCRTTSLVAFGVPLLMAVFAWAKQRHGARAGLVALVLTGFSPTLLAHGGLITADLAVTSMGLLAVYLFWKAERQGGGALAWGSVLGLALLAKGSAWLFALAILVLAALRRAAGAPAPPLRRLAAGLGLAVLVVNAGYGFSGVADLSGKRDLLAKVPDSAPARLVAWSAAPLFPLPYLKSMATQLHVGARGRPTFLMGEVSSRGFRRYYVVALGLKETLPLLLLLLLALALAWRREEWLDDAAILVPAALVLVAFSLARLQIGVRYVLPAIPFLAMFAAGLWRDARATLRLAVVALAAWHVVAAARACPYFIPYFNELAGGSANGYRYLGDSNLDWGQNQSEAEVYARDRGLPLDPDVLPAAGGVVVSATRLQGTFEPDRYRVLREEYDPVGNVGYAYLVYDLDQNRRALRAP